MYDSNTNLVLGTQIEFDTKTGWPTESRSQRDCDFPVTLGTRVMGRGEEAMASPVIGPQGRENSCCWKP